MAYNDIFRLRVYQTMHSAQVVNVMHFVQDDPLPSRGAQELANDFVTNMTATIKARTVGACTFNYVEVQSIVPFSGASAITAFPGGTVGTVGGQSASATLCEVLTIYSERAGRRGRGRLYLPSSDSSTAGASVGAWLPAQTTRTQAFATALFNRYIIAGHPIGWVLGVWSRASGPVLPPWTSSQFARATGLTVRTTIRTQRRRQLGVGR
jgi:hypothetical protein